MLLKVLSKVNWVLSGTSVTFLIFLETFLTMFNSRVSGEISSELNFRFWNFLVLSLVSGKKKHNSEILL